MALDPLELNKEVEDFLVERHLASLTLRFNLSFIREQPSDEIFLFGISMITLAILICW